MKSSAGPSMYDRVTHNKNVEVIESPYTNTCALECACVLTCWLCVCGSVCYSK